MLGGGGWYMVGSSAGEGVSVGVVVSVFCFWGFGWDVIFKG